MRDIPPWQEEALLTAAGVPSQHKNVCDFRLDRTSDHDWSIAAISVDAREWLHKELCGPLCQCLNDTIVVDVLSADRFLKQLHDNGFRTEFVGLSGTDTF